MYVGIIFDIIYYFSSIQGTGILGYFIVYVLQIPYGLRTMKYNSENSFEAEGSTLTHNEDGEHSDALIDVNYLPNLPEERIPTTAIFSRLAFKNLHWKLLYYCLAFITLISDVNIWRGYWYLLDAYFISSQYELSLITGAVYGVMLLVLLFSACSLYRGIEKDEYFGKNALIEFYHLSYFYIKVRRCKY